MHPPSAIVMNTSPSLLRLWLRILTFRSSMEDYASLNWRHLLAGLLVCWLVGIGRYWDDPRATLLQHAGVGSVIYVFLLTAMLWIIVKPLHRQRFSYLGILTMVTMTAPPAAFYAIPVEKWMTLEEANQMNLCFLAVVAALRLSLWIHYLVKFGQFSAWTTFVCAALPMGIILVALIALNLHHVVVDIMGGIREADQSSQDAAYGAITLLGVLAVPISAFTGLSWIVLACRNWKGN
jgi:hypothetical protein